MIYANHYESSLGKIFLAAEDKKLIGLWFEGQKFFARHLKSEPEEKDLKIFDITKEWLNIYFSGKEPNFTPQLQIIGTEFQVLVWKLLFKIPYGEITTYSDLAKIVAKQKNVSSISPQAVGGAVARNAISIIIPCHRVVGKDGNLRGYASGLSKKYKLLNLEKVNTKKFFCIYNRLISED